MTTTTALTQTRKLALRRQKVMGSAYRLFYEDPLEVVEAKGVWLTDTRGNRFLDCYNNVPHVGHCHPEIVKAMSEQAERLNTHTRYLNATVLNYAERLVALLPDDLDNVMFACSGSEANELALRLAREATGQDGIICTQHAYHGNSFATSQISPEDTAMADLGDNIATVSLPDFSSPSLSPDQALQSWVSQLQSALEKLLAKGHKPAAFIVDTVLSSEGIPDIPMEFVATAREMIHNAGGLFIADEVQAGFARTGDTFWGFERFQLQPDIVTMGKPMGNGYPISAVVTRHDIVDRFVRKYHYFNTFGGSPVACAAANAVLNVIDAENLQSNAIRVGEYIRAGMKRLAADHELISDVRGSGLFIGAELSNADRSPAISATKKVINSLREKHVLVGSTGPHNNVLKVRPPMVFSVSNADYLLERLKQVFDTLD